MQQTKPYEFGDSLANMDIPGSLINAMIRDGPGLPIRMKPEDIEIHRTRNTPKCATVVLLDMSGSMRYDGLYVNVKRMGLALDGLIRREYPGDFLQFVEMYTFAKPRRPGEIVQLMPKPVTIFDPVVRLRADMSDPNISEMLVPPHFTNIQHGLQLARQFLAAQDTPNRQVILITDGLPTAHFEGKFLYLLYPPDPPHRRRHAARRPPLPARRDHDQHLPAAQLVAVARRRAVRLPPGRIDPGPRLLHRRPRPRPLRGVGLSEPATRNRGVMLDARIFDSLTELKIDRLSELA